MRALKVLGWLVALVFGAACQEEMLDESPVNDSGQIEIHVSGEAGTRLSMVQDNDALNIVWRNGDAFWIQSVSDNSSSTFTLSSGAGTTQGTFTGTELTESDSYRILYPASLGSYGNFIYFDYSGQVQNGNNNTDHLSEKTAFFYLGSDYKNFSMTAPNAWMSSCLKLSFKNLPVAIQPESMTLTFDFGKNISYYVRSISTSTVSTVTYDLGFTGFSCSTQDIVAYRMIPSGSSTIPAGTVVSVSLSGKDEMGNNMTLTNKFTLDTETVLTKGKIHKFTFGGKDHWENLLYSSVDYSKDALTSKSYKTLQTATAQGISKGTDIVLMGDGFTDKDIEDGTYDAVMQKLYEDMFSEYPFTVLKPYFNVYSVYVVSKNRKLTNEPTDGANGAQDIGGLETALSTAFTDNSTRVSGDNNKVLDYAEVALKTSDRMNSALMVVGVNTPRYAGTCYQILLYDGGYTDYAEMGAAVAYFPLGHAQGSLTADMMRRRLVNHEAMGHGFGKLGDEYSYNTWYSYPSWDDLASLQSHGLYRNVDKYETGVIDETNVLWHGMFGTANEYEKLTDSAWRLGVYEGGMTYSSGFCRPTESSIMRNNVYGFNPPSRWAIWYRLAKLTGSSLTSATSFSNSLADFLLWDASYAQSLAITRALSQEEEKEEWEKLVPLPPMELICR